MRRNYLDNIRWSIVILVVIYHVVYIFNSAGVLSTIGIKEIQEMDVILYFLYPWFMACLFLVGGISARYFLIKIDGKQFAKERARRLLVPSLAGIFILVSSAFIGFCFSWVFSLIDIFVISIISMRSVILISFVFTIIYSKFFKKGRLKTI